MTAMVQECRCGRRVTDGFMCTLCSRVLAELVHAAPMWADDLVLVRARLARYGGFTGRGTDRSPLPVNIAASDALRHLDKSIRCAAESMGAGTDIRHARLGVVAAWVCRNMDSLRRVASAPHHAAQIERSMLRAKNVCDRPMETWYAGRCECGFDLYPTVEQEWIECYECGKEWKVEERRRELLDSVADAIAPGPDIARALTALENPVTPERLRKWRQREMLAVAWTDDGPPLTHWYRVGDVLELIRKGSR